MTTIAYRDGVMAADTLGIYGGGIRSKCKKLCRVKTSDREWIIGLTGNYPDGLMFVDWWGDGQDMSSLPKFQNYRGSEDAPDFSALVLSKGSLDLWTEHFQRDPIFDAFIAFGSGAYAAMGAMYMGATAAEAVAVAAKVDYRTGGEIEAMRLHEEMIRVAE